jgi:isochorismate hydrolase
MLSVQATEGHNDAVNTEVTRTALLVLDAQTAIVEYAPPAAESVLGTAMAAADMDFGLHVLSDACFDARTDAHNLLIKDLLPAMATVLSAEEWPRP